MLASPSYVLPDCRLISPVGSLQFSSGRPCRHVFASPAASRTTAAARAAAAIPPAQDTPSPARPQHPRAPGSRPNEPPSPQRSHHCRHSRIHPRRPTEPPPWAAAETSTPSRQSPSRLLSL
uniref:Uncharacterized protein n=1 Tax=Phytophthora fragariae TaxID=53985 RepID=A0A6A3F6I6_9STRA|nr:hypothetical protein PF009_g9268 [Phytophthora fragariae]